MVYLPLKICYFVLCITDSPAVSQFIQLLFNNISKSFLKSERGDILYSFSRTWSISSRICSWWPFTFDVLFNKQTSPSISTGSNQQPYRVNSYPVSVDQTAYIVGLPLPLSATQCFTYTIFFFIWFPKQGNGTILKLFSGFHLEADIFWLWQRASWESFFFFFSFFFHFLWG